MGGFRMKKLSIMVMLSLGLISSIGWAHKGKRQGATSYPISICVENKSNQPLTYFSLTDDNGVVFDPTSFVWNAAPKCKTMTFVEIPGPTLNLGLGTMTISGAPFNTQFTVAPQTQ